MAVHYIVLGNEKIGKKELESLADYMYILTSKESKRFIEYLQSPFFNAEPYLATLYVYLCEAADRDTERINATNLFKKLGKQLVAKELRDAIKSLIQHIKDFLVLCQVQADEGLYLSALNSKVRNQGKSGVVNQVVSKQKKVLMQAPLDVSTLKEDWWIQHQYYFEYDNDREAFGLDQIQALRTHLEHVYTTARVVYDCEEMHLRRAAHQITSAAAEEDPNVLVQLFLLHKEVFEASPDALEVPLRLFTEAFTEATSKSSVSILSLYALAKYTVNTLAKVVNYGHVEWMELLYEWMQRVEVLQPKPIRRVPSSEFLNRVNVGCYLGKLDETQAYISNFKPYLSPETHDLDMGIATMCVRFKEGNYSAIVNAIDTEFSRRIDPHCSYNLRVKTIRLKAAVELALQEDTRFEEYFQRADEDLKKYLSRNKKLFSPEVYEKCINFLNLTRKLVNIYESNLYRKELEVDCKKLLQQIEDASLIMAKDWLIQKCKEITATR